jgi:UDP-glucose 4-epimerase
MKSVLVTGSSGFIGRNLVNRLVKDGYKVTKFDKIQDPNGHTKLGDINTFNLKELGTFDVIYHFAAPCSVIQFNKDPVNSVRTTTHGFTKILELAGNNNSRVIYPSSGNVYGLNLQCKEDTEPIPTNLYAVSKLACEDMAYLSGLDAIGFRIFAGYGDYEEKKGELSSVVGTFVNDILNDKSPIIWGDGSQARDFVHISNIVDILVQSIDKEELPPIVNIGNGMSTTFKDLIDKINLALGKDIQPTYVPKPSSYVEKTCANTNLMHEYFNVNLIPLDDGIKRYIKYLNR